MVCYLCEVLQNSVLIFSVFSHLIFSAAQVTIWVRRNFFLHKTSSR
jgi:hypothetical protein